VICPDRALAEQLGAALEKTGAVAVWRRLDRYPAPSEMARLLRSGAPQVVFVSLSSLQDAVAVARAVELNAPGVQIAAIHDACPTELLLEVMRAGVREFLHPPFQTQALREAISRIQELAGRNQPQPETTDAVFTFLPAKPGVGASTVALNTSVALSDHAGARVLLADFDLNSGLIGFLLKLENPYTLAHAAEHASKLDDNLWPQLVSRVGRLDVIPSGRINVGFRIEPVQIRYLLEYARRNHTAICADLSGNLERYSIELMNESKCILLVTTAELPALHLAREKLAFLRSIELGDRVSVLLNRAHKRSVVKAAEIEQLLGAPVFQELPNDYEAVQKSVAAGKPVERSTELGKRFRELAGSLLGKPETLGQKRRFVEYFSILPAGYSLLSSGKKSAT